ncbi:hypothetical protein [Asticcacaulis sp. AC402]|nr:hypothetical protein [Asticcacaulis sp. AC402]
MIKVNAVNWIAAARQFAPQASLPVSSAAFARPVTQKPDLIAKRLA